MYILELLHPVGGRFRFTYPVCPIKYPRVKKINEGDEILVKDFFGDSFNRELLFADDEDDPETVVEIVKVASISIQDTPFVYNRCGVCINPEQVYYFMLEKDLGWRYIELTVCSNEDGTKWSYGCKTLTYGSPCVREGRYTSKENAIESGIEFLKRSFEKQCSIFGDHSQHKKHFYTWLASRRQLSLF